MTEKKLKISVIMPFYNCEKYLDESIQSILDQTFEDFEFIIINDASTDNSDEVVKKYLSDKRIVYIINKTNKGIVHNLNHGIQIAKADVIARMDGDDISDIKRFQDQYNLLIKDNLDLVGCHLFIIDRKGKIKSKMRKPISHQEIEKAIFKYLPVMNGCFMGKKKIFEKIQYRQKYLYAEEYDLLFRLILENFKLQNLNKYSYSYRMHPCGTLNRFPIKKAKAVFRLKKEMIKKFDYRLSLEDYFILYTGLMLGYFPGWFSLFCERLYKRLLHSQ